VGCVDVSKEAAPGLRLGYMQWGTQFENATVVAAVAGGVLLGGFIGGLEY